MRQTTGEEGTKEGGRARGYVASAGLCTRGMRFHGAYRNVAMTESSMAQRLEVEPGYKRVLTDSS